MPCGRDRWGLLGGAAAHEPAGAVLLDALEQLLGLHGSGVLRYSDLRRGQRRSVRLDADGADRKLGAVLHAGDVTAARWLRPLLQDGLPAQQFGRWLLSPVAQVPGETAPRGTRVCSCLDVGEAQIVAALGDLGGREDQRVAALQQTLRCGTQCGSCLPEVRRLVRRSLAAA